MMDRADPQWVGSLARLTPEDHPCLIYETAEEQFATVVPYIRLGLERGEKCIYIADDNTPETVQTALRAGGIDVEASIRRGALAIISKYESYLRNRCFDPQEMIRFLETVMQAAEREGFAGTRGAAEMTWVLKGEPGSHRLLEYEAEVNCFAASHAFLVLCQYNRRRFSPEVILDAIHTHPMVIAGGTVCRNFYYIPPQEFLGPIRVEREVERLLRNVRARERAEEDLRESEERFRTLFRGAPDAIFLADPGTGTILDANPMAARLLGRAREELVGLHQADLHPPALREMVKRVFQEHVRAEVVFQPVELPVLRADGNEFPVEITASTIHLQGRSVLQGIFRDITQRKLAEEQLRITQFSVDRASDAVFWIGEDAQFLYVNEAACRSLGYSREELLGRTVADVDPDFPRERWPVHWQELKEGGSLHFESRHRSQDGRVFPVEISANYLEFGGIGYNFAFARDITERKRVQEELARYRDHLEELVEQRTRELEHSREQFRKAERLASLGTLAAGMAHEVNNPVGAILLAAQNALEQMGAPETTPAVRRALENIAEDAQRCGRIVKSLLQFARREQTHKWAQPLGPVLERAIQLTEDYAKRNGAVLKTQWSEGLPEVVINPVEMEQVCVNLIRNAIEAVEGQGQVLIRTEETLRGVRLQFCDDGRGVPEEQKEHLFDPFYTTRRSQGGTGLGLSIVHGIIMEHGGRVSVQSQAGRGTTVMVELPRAPREDTGDVPCPKSS